MESRGITVSSSKYWAIFPKIPQSWAEISSATYEKHIVFDVCLTYLGRQLG